MQTFNIVILILFQSVLSYGLGPFPKLPKTRGKPSAKTAGKGKTAEPPGVDFGGPSLSSTSYQSSTRYTTSWSIQTSSPAITSPPSLSAVLEAPRSAWDSAGSSLAEEVSSLLVADNSSVSYTDNDTATDTDSCETDTACSACADAVATIAACVSASSSSFISGGANYAWTCLCNDWIASEQTYTWVGSEFDAPYSSCVEYVSSSFADEISDWTPMNGFCSKVSASYWARAVETTSDGTGTTAPTTTTGSSSLPAQTSSGNRSAQSGLAVSRSWEAYTHDCWLMNRSCSQHLRLYLSVYSFESSNVNVPYRTALAHALS